ncbi:MAG: aminopeptidase P family N-terminal domain-containing protein, partial [Lachnospiraceae bacterium]|nr:aminopeptidase P family N-terminal domain-containing protein [Lachnospiraceae bacterium]
MVSSEEILKRLTMFRTEMKNEGIDVFLLLSTDPHASEYVSDHYKTTEFVSGCTSDNVVLVIEQDCAKLWTDGRYFISAAQELKDTGIELMKSGQPGVPKPEDYLRGTLHSGMVLAFDGTCVNAEIGQRYRDIAKSCGAKVESSPEAIDQIWMTRPALPCSPIWVLKDEIAGKSCADKLADVRRALEEKGCGHLILSKLDDIMWLLNLRGDDVECNPVALSYLLVGPETADVFLQKEAVTAETAEYLKENRIKVHEYTEILDYLKDYHFEAPVLIDRGSSSDTMVRLLKDKGDLVNGENPTAMMKAVKNCTEIENIQKYYLLDSVAVCRFIYQIKTRDRSVRMTEMDAAAMIDSLRAEIPGFIGLSFPTIPAVGPNAAMAHYMPSAESAAEVGEEGFLLVDSGAHYLGATTDVTRTIALGELTEEMKRDFTLVAVSNLELLYTGFAKGTSGAQLDMIARAPLYRYGMDFNHGTGHGIGYILNVHEGPQRIGHASSAGSEIPMAPGMITSDEPGIYREGKYGIRTESIMLTVYDKKNEFGEFLKHEPLTFAPIDLDAIDTRYMERLDVEYLNDYHAKV